MEGTLSQESDGLCVSPSLVTTMALPSEGESRCSLRPPSSSPGICDPSPLTLTISESSLLSLRLLVSW